jgi:hypothetical protein
MSKNQISDKRKELKEKITALNDKLSNPSSYRVGLHQPYINSQAETEDREKLNGLIKEYQNLPNPSIVEAELVMKKSISFTNGRYVLKYNPDKDSWQFYDGTVYLTSNIKFSEDGETDEAINTTVSSDNFGEPVDRIYRMKVKSSTDPIVEKAQPIPCSKIIEGVAAIPNTEKDYMLKMGYVWDETYKKYRKPTPDEYCATLHSIKKVPEKNKRGLSFSSFLGVKKSHK